MAAVVRERFFVNILNLSQLTKPIQNIQRINPEKANEVLDTNIFELLPAQPSRQDDIDRFFIDFNDLIGPKPGFIDVDGDGVGEQTVNYEQDESIRISADEPTPNAFIARLDSQVVDDSNNQGKTLESMRNKLNTYLGDVDNVIEDMEDQRPLYENVSEGFLKIRKPNQAIILRSPDDGQLEFQKEVDGEVYISSLGLTEVTGPSYLVDGFTITMWVRFLSKTSEGTLFNYGNPLYSEGKGGFRLDTKVNTYNDETYRYFRLCVYDNIEEINGIEEGDMEFRNTPIRDNHHGYTGPDPNLGRVSQRTISNQHDAIHNAFPNVKTDDLDEWYFICATYNPKINEKNYVPLEVGETDYSSEDHRYSQNFEAFANKEYWLNHLLINSSDTNMELFESFGIATLNNAREMYVTRDYITSNGSAMIEQPFFQQIQARLDAQYDWEDQNGNMFIIVDDEGRTYDMERGVFGATGGSVGKTLIGYFVGPLYDSGTEEANTLYNETYGEGNSVQVTIAMKNSGLIPPRPSELTSAWDNIIYNPPSEAQNQIVSNSGEGAKCKIEIISRSELLRARGYKLPEDDLVIENLYAESTETLTLDGDDFDYDGPIDAGDPVEETTQQETFAG